MENFPLLPVFPQLLQKIIRKLPTVESYFCMRQTCKYVNDVAEGAAIFLDGQWRLKVETQITTNKKPDPNHIENLLSGEWEQDYEEIVIAKRKLHWIYYSNSGPKSINIRGLYRARLAIFKMKGDFTFIHNYLTKHQISCKTLFFIPQGFTNSIECRELIQTMKPMEIDLIERQLSRPLAQIQGLKTVTIRESRPDLLFFVARELFPHFENVIVCQRDVVDNDWWINEMVDIMQNLQLYPLPNLQHFMFAYQNRLQAQQTTTEQLLERFAQFNPDPDDQAWGTFKIRLRTGGRDGPLVSILNWRSFTGFSEALFHYDPIISIRQ